MSRRRRPSSTAPPRAVSTSSTHRTSIPWAAISTTRGVTEEILGRWLRGKRDRFIVATKCFAPTGPAPFDAGNSRKHILAAVDASLRRLQTDYIDLYQLHGYDRRRRSTRRSAPSTTSSTRARSATSAARTSSPTSWCGPSAGARRCGWPASTPCSPATTCSSARSSARCCRSAARKASASSPTTRSPAACSRASTPATAPPPEGTRFTLGNAARNYQDRYWHDREFDTVERCASSPRRPG